MTRRAGIVIIALLVGIIAILCIPVEKRSDPQTVTNPDSSTEDTGPIPSPNGATTPQIENEPRPPQPIA